MNKPDGLTFIGPSSIESFIGHLTVEKFYGVGKVTAEKMKKMNLHIGADLKKLSEHEMIQHFGKVGRFYYKIVRGIDDRPVEPNQETKSIGAEDTFPYDLSSINEMNAELDKIAKTVYNRLQLYQLKGRTITLKIKYSDFKQITRSRSFAASLNDLNTIATTAKELLSATDLKSKKIRLLGITVSNFNEPKQNNEKENSSGQLELF
jgi:DNA polymerase-4